MSIEYDGFYWHSSEAKQMLDLAKSGDLLAAGYLVVRLRENDLPSLDILDPGYLELQVYSVAPRPETIMEAIAEWVSVTRAENENSL